MGRSYQQFSLEERCEIARRHASRSIMHRAASDGYSITATTYWQMNCTSYIFCLYYARMKKKNRSNTGQADLFGKDAPTSAGRTATLTPSSEEANLQKSVPLDGPSYFARSYPKLSFPIADGNGAGFREAQIAAIHAVNAHLYSRPTEAAIVVMPTGSGKTTVLNSVAFCQRATRILVLTPSRLVREQIAEGFKTLSELKSIGALPQEHPTPSVFSTKGRVDTHQAWEDLRAFDVVVATVPSVSPRIETIPAPPEDLFDLILVDEAHHSPAATWRALLDHFKRARRVHFTATPFRSDEREIEGKLAFVYELRRAHQDGVFGNIRFQPVEVIAGENSDVAIARAAESSLRADQSAGLQHLLMVRTDSRERANALKKIYEEHTRLNLRLIAGNQSLKHVEGVIESLRRFELDGVICVNMLAEGFNLPNLKVAAIHAPHRSLAVTLQFVGRFARTTAANLGPATFLAVPSEHRIESMKLFRHDAVWHEIVQNLSAMRVAEEIRVREYLDTFEKRTVTGLDDFSLYTVQPYHHVKILSVPDGVDLRNEIDFPAELTPIYRGYSDSHNAVFYVTSEVWQAPWSDDERLENIVYDMFMLYHDSNAKLLFICASRRHASIYDRLASCVSLGRRRPLSASRLNRVLSDLEGLELFSVGMRNRSTLSNAESYRILAGPAPDRAIQKSDGRLFDRGHWFGRASDGGEQITIGVSSASKVWSNTSSSIPELIDWCARLAGKLDTGSVPITGSGLDYLSVGEELIEIPQGVRVACWEKDVYIDPPTIRYRKSDGMVDETNLLDLDLVVESSDEDSIRIAFIGDEVRYTAIFAIDADRYYSPATPAEPHFSVMHGRDETPFIDFLNDSPLSFYTADLSRIEGFSLYRVPTELSPFDLGFFEVVDWNVESVEIEIEKPPAAVGKLSIFEWLERRLLGSDAEVVYFDDGAGEIADYVAIREGEAFTSVMFYHCKASGGANPGARVNDAYDVCGQAVKSAVWTRAPLLLNRLATRLDRPIPSKYLRGDSSAAERLLGNARVRDIRFEIVVVQPGFSRRNLPERVGSLLAAANDYLVRGGVLPLKVLGSS